MSKREEIVEEFVGLLHEKGLDEVYGINTGIDASKKYRYATFCRARTLDGQVNVYGPKFIQVTWQTANRSLPHKGSEVFKSVEEAKTFIKETF